MDEPLAEMIRYLRLSGLLDNWETILKEAAKDNYSHTRLLKRVVEEEYKIRRDKASQMRHQRAYVPQPFRIETYPFHEQPNLDKKRVMLLYEGFDYMTNHRNVIWVGKTGCGKTGLGTAFLLQAIDRGYSGRHVLFAELVAELYASLADHSLPQKLKRYTTYDCLLIDEVGYTEIEPQQGALFFSLMQKRHFSKTTIITSNLGFGEWGGFLKNEQLTAALLDRLTESSYVINMRRCRSLRHPLDPKNDV